MSVNKFGTSLRNNNNNNNNNEVAMTMTRLLSSADERFTQKIETAIASARHWTQRINDLNSRREYNERCRISLTAQLSQLEDDLNTAMERRFDHLKDRLEEFTTSSTAITTTDRYKTKSKRGSTATMTMINDADNIGYDFETTNNERSRNTCTD